MSTLALGGAPPKIELRPYQRQALDAIAEAQARGVKRQLGVAFTGAGKGLALGTPVLTANGWRPVEDLVVGDQVVGADGHPVAVTGVFHRGLQPAYRVTTEDGVSIVVDADHLWTVTTDAMLKLGRSWRTLSTEELADTYVSWRIPVTQPVERPDTPLSIDPYVLGVLLSDGSGGSGMVVELEQRLPKHLALVPLVTFLQGRRGGRCQVPSPADFARDTPDHRFWAGVVDLDLNLTTKRIPRNFLESSIEQRLDLLRGLMDCDGHMESFVEFSTSSMGLAQDMVELVQSLGGIATIYADPWGANVILRFGMNPFLLERKAAKWSSKPRTGPVRRISAIEPIDPTETVCIKVDAADGLFVTVGHVVTHNTILFGTMAAETPGPTLILAHRDELISQAAEKVSWVCPDRDIGIVKAERNEGWSDVVVASIQTVSVPRRLRNLIHRHQRNPFSLVVVDEAHHASAASYRTVLNALGCGPMGPVDGAPQPLLLGVTATPDRGDKTGLDSVFDEIVFNYDLGWGIEAGYLCDLRGIQVKLAVDLGTVAKSKGDYQDGALGAALEAADAPGHVVASWMEHAIGRRTIVFCPTVDLAQATADAFGASGIRAGVVWGAQDIADRRRTLAAFARGDLDVVTNCGVLTEGYDNPRVDCIVMARPTQSRALYAQVIGRGTRKHVDKTDCLVLDCVGVASEHKLCTVPTLLGIDPKGFENGTAKVSDGLVAMRAKQVAMGVLQAKEIELLGKLKQAPIAWVHVDAGYAVMLPQRMVLLEKSGDEWVATSMPAGYGVKGRNVELARAADLEWAQGAAEDYVRRQAPQLTARDAPWRKTPPSDKQLAFARKLGIQVDPTWSKGDVSQAIDAKMAARQLKTRRK